MEVSDFAGVSGGPHGDREKKAVALSSVAASFFLTAGKLVVALLTGSLGILSEAAHSALDLGAALITYFAVRVSDKPADDTHHYGHARVENFSALAEAFLLLVVCFWIVWEAVRRLTSGNVHMEITFWSYAVLVVSILVDFSRSRALARAARKYNSQALEADALHFSSDILSSAVVLFGIILSRFGFYYGDSLAAIAVAGIVVTASLKLAKRTADVLLDKAPEGLDKIITEEVLKTPGIVGVHKVRLRQSGGRVYGDLHVVMDRNISFVKGHKIAGSVENRMTRYGSDIVVHFEPEDDWDELAGKVSEARETIAKILQDQSGGIVEYHDLAVFRGPQGMNVNVHVVLPKEITVEKARETCDYLEKCLEKAIDEADINFRIEPCDGICGQCHENCSEEVSQG